MPNLASARRSLGPALLLFLGMGVGALYAADGPPAQGIPYQGRLELAGQPYSGATTLSFRLWDVATGGTTPLFEEELATQVNRGAFGVILGEGGLPDAVFTSDDLYLQVGVGSLASPTWLAGRQRILPAAQSVRAGRAFNFDVEGNQIAAPTDFTITNGTARLQMGNGSGTAANNQNGDVALHIGNNAEMTVADLNGNALLRVGNDIPGTEVTGDLQVSGSIAAGVRLKTCAMVSTDHEDCFCGAGEVAISGGVYGSVVNRVTMRESRPVYDAATGRYGWRAACMQFNGNSFTFFAQSASCTGEVFALCARITPDN